MRGLRTQESSKFLRFFEIVQKAAEEQGEVFFLDTGEGRDFETELLEGEDLSGWLVPQNEADEFEAEWSKWAERQAWDRYSYWAEWKNADRPEISFHKIAVHDDWPEME